jgi:tight adherence protein C
VTGAHVVAALAGVLAALGTGDLLPRLPMRRSLGGRTAADVATLIATLPRRLASRLGTSRIAPPATLSERITAAGSPGGLSAREWMGLKCLAVLAGFAAAAFVAGSLPGRLELIALTTAPAAGFVLPDFALARIAGQRAEEALRELPGMLDLLRVTVESGRPPLDAIGMVGARFDGPLAAEWRMTAAQVALGVSHDAALADLVRRLPAAGIRTLADTLASAARRGLPLADALAAQAAAARHARRHQIAERAARAAPKMQLVVALVLVPSVMLALAAVLVSELTATGLGFEY